MADKQVLLVFTKPMAKLSIPQTGDEVNVTGNVVLWVDEYIVDLFNIPVPTEEIAADIITIDSFTYKRWVDKERTTTKDITVPSYQKKVATGVSLGAKVIRLADKTKTMNTPGPGVPPKYRSVSIRFPPWFNLIMLDQALGTMIRANEPKSWKIDATGKSYPLRKYTETGLKAGLNSGAWVATTPVSPVNTDEAGVGESTVVKGKKG